MAPLGRFLFRLLERIFGIYVEGPTTPPRYLEELRVFRVMFPLANAEDWERHATSIVDRAYRDGWIRGWEWTERYWPDPPSEHQRLEEARRHSVSLAEQDAAWRERMENVAPPMSAREVEEARANRLHLQLTWDRLRAIPGPRERQRRGIR